MNVYTLRKIALFFLLINLTACNFAPGSYPYAEEYEINTNEAALIKEIEKFKKDNPKYEIPIGTQVGGGRADAKDFWYGIYFYYPIENQIIFTWTRPVSKEKTIFGFVGVNEGLLLGHWKEINKDFNSKENREQKKKFEDLILSRIKQNLIFIKK